MARAVIWLGAVGFAVFGIACFAAPSAVFGWMGLEVGPNPWPTEIRAFYGGLELGLAALLMQCALRPSWRHFGLVLTACAYGGIGVARLLGMLIDGTWSGVFVAALAVELGMAAAAVVGMRRA